MGAPLILVVDDNPPLRYALGRTLRQHGFEVLDAATGEEALRLSDSEQPDLVLLDVSLPDLHGFDVARRLRQAESTKSIPILQIGYSAGEVIGRTGEAAGAPLLAAPILQRLNRGDAVSGVEQHHRRKDGTDIEVSLFAAPLDRSAAPRFVVILEDISGRKAFERERAELLARERSARTETESADRL